MNLKDKVIKCEHIAKMEKTMKKHKHRILFSFL